MTLAAAEEPERRPGVLGRLARRPVEVLVVVTFFLLGLGWLVSFPLGAGADESSHYLRVVGLSYGHPIGGDLPADEVSLEGPPANGRQVTKDRLVEEGGVFTIPGDAQPPYICNLGELDQPWDCPGPKVSATPVRVVSWHARTLPGSYVVPAVLSRLGGHASTKYYLARIGYLLQGTALFAVAVAVAAPLLRGSRPEVYLLGLFAVPPVFTHQLGLLSPDGTEACALLAFTAMLLAWVHAPTRRRWWSAAALAALVPWVRDLGLVLVPVVVAVVAVAAYPRVKAARASLRRMDLLAPVVAIGAFLGAALWRLLLLYNAGAGDLTTDRLGRAWKGAMRALTASFGITGAGDVPVNVVLRLLWWAAALGLAVSLALRNRRWAVTGAAIAVFYVVLNMYLWLTQEALGFFLYSRYTLGVLGVAVLVPSALFAVGGAGGRLVRGLAVPLGGLAAAGHISVYVLVGHRYATGTAHPLSFRHATWRPPIGWAGAFTLIGVACALVAVLPVVACWATTRSRLRSGGRSPSSSAGP